MSAILTNAAAEISTRMNGTDFSDSLKIDVEGEGSLIIAADGVSVSDGDADCTLSMSAETFQAVVDGDTSAAAAFMTGAIKVDGDMGVAMKLSPVLG